MPQQRGWERKIAEGPPCVVLASPGFMQTGTSRELFELWAPDSRNGLIVTGYSVEGTLARVSVPQLSSTAWGYARSRLYVTTSNVFLFVLSHTRESCTSFLSFFHKRGLQDKLISLPHLGHHDRT